MSNSIPQTELAIASVLVVGALSAAQRSAPVIDNESTAVRHSSVAQGVAVSAGQSEATLGEISLVTQPVSVIINRNIEFERIRRQTSDAPAALAPKSKDNHIGSPGLNSEHSVVQASAEEPIDIDQNRRKVLTTVPEAQPVIPFAPASQRPGVFLETPIIIRTQWRSRCCCPNPTCR